MKRENFRVGLRVVCTDAVPNPRYRGVVFEIIETNPLRGRIVAVPEPPHEYSRSRAPLLLGTVQALLFRGEPWLEPEQLIIREIPA